MSADRPRRRWVVAGIAGPAVVGLVLVSAGIGLLTGPPAVVLAVIAWVALPTSTWLARRLALTGTIALGALPILWWVPSPQPGRLGHAAVLLALALGACAVLALGRRGGWRTLIPRVGRVDLLLPVALAAAAWMMLPLLRASGGTASAAMLLQVTAGDNVSHFHMFEITRQLGVAGFGWGGGAPHGGGYPFANYPQHFHSFAVLISQLVGGTAVGGIPSEAGLYLVSSAATLLVALGTLIAAILAIPRLRRRPGLAVVVVALTVSTLVAGFGSTSLRYGFAPFQLAVISVVLVIAWVAGSRRMSIRTLAAVVSGIVVVGFTWTLAVTLVIPALLAALLLLPRTRHRRRSVVIPTVVLLLALAAAGAVAAVAGLASVAGVGGAANALGLDGSVPDAPPVTLVLVAVAIAIGVVLTVRRSWWGIAVAGAGILGAVQYAALLRLGYAVSDALVYYPVKFLDALFLTSVPVVAIAGAVLLTRLRMPSRTIALGATALATVAAVLAPGLPWSLPSPAPQQAAGWALRDELDNAAGSPTVATLRLLAAARAMRGTSCPQPIYLAPAEDDLPILNGEQWALSLSRTWSDADLPIGRYLKRVGAHGNARVDSSAVVTTLLSGHPDRCVLASDATLAGLDAATRDRFAAQLLPLPASG